MLALRFEQSNSRLEGNLPSITTTPAQTATLLAPWQQAPQFFRPADRAMDPSIDRFGGEQSQASLLAKFEAAGDLFRRPAFGQAVLSAPGVCRKRGRSRRRFARFHSGRNCRADRQRTLLASNRHAWCAWLGTVGKWCRGEDSNLRPTHYECVALPAELPRQAPNAPSVYLRCSGLATAVLPASALRGQYPIGLAPVAESAPDHARFSPAEDHRRPAAPDARGTGEPGAGPRPLLQHRQRVQRHPATGAGYGVHRGASARALVANQDRVDRLRRLGSVAMPVPGNFAICPGLLRQDQSGGDARHRLCLDRRGGLCDSGLRLADVRGGDRAVGQGRPVPPMAKTPCCGW